MKVFATLKKVLLLSLTSIFIFASCSTNIDDQTANNSNDSLRICVTQNNANTSRAVATPYTAEVVISQNNATIAKKSKNIAREGTSFEFNNLPYNDELNIELNLYIDDNKIATGSKKHTIIPNVDNLVEITISKLTLNDASLSGSAAEKAPLLLDFANNTFTFGFSSVPNIDTLMQSLNTFTRVPGTNYYWTLDFTAAGAKTYTAADLKKIQVAKQSNNLPILSIKVADGSTVELNSDDTQAVQIMTGNNVKVNWVQDQCPSRIYSEAMNCLAESQLQNVELDLSSMQITLTQGATPVKYVPSTQLDSSPTNVKSVVLTGIEKINSDAFRYWTSLTSVTIPASVTYLGKNCFDTTITTINFADTSTKWKQNGSGFANKTIQDVKDNLGVTFFTK